MRYLSLFSGVEAASLAWAPLGWECVGVAEIDPFPCAVLKHRFPNVPNLGSVTDITEAQIAALGPIDLVVGGSPCQDLSVAGKRAGLAGVRSGLFAHQMRIFHAARLLCGARWLVWENVPGAFSTNRGRDFAVVVGEMAGREFDVPADGWGTEGVALGDNGLVEWSVLDAQWFGVAQRRRRVFAVLDAGDWQNRQPVLLEQDSLRGDTAPSRQAGQGTACGTEGGAGVCRASVTMAHGQGGAEIAEDRAPTLTCNHEAPIAFLPETAHTLRDEGFDASEDGTGRGTPLVPVSVAMRGRDGGAACEVGDECAFTLRASSGGGDKPYALAPVAFTTEQTPKFNVDCALTLTKQSPTGGGQVQSVAVPLATTAMQVRRLTPRECERLQGMPDDWTLIPYRGKPEDKCPDGPRYKAIGNSMAVPVMAWIGRQIQAAHDYEVAPW